MTPIISPWLVYWISVADGIKTFCMVGSICIGAGIGFVCIFWVMIKADGAQYCGDDGHLKSLSRLSVALILPGLLMAVGSLAIPDKNTCIAMLVARELTYERADKLIAAGGDARQALKQDITEIIQAVMGKDATQ